MFGIGFSELVVIFIVALLVFGPKRLPEVARKLSKGVKDLREAADDARSTILSGMDHDAKTLSSLRPRREDPMVVPPAVPEAERRGSSPQRSGGEDSDSKPKSSPPPTPPTPKA